MSNGDVPAPGRNPFSPPLPDPAQPEIFREKRFEQNLEARIRARQNRAFFPGPDPFPVDVPPVTVPRPAVPGAGSAIPGALARLILRGGVASIALGGAVKILEDLANDQLDREIRELEAQLERQRQIRKQRQTEIREITLPPAPQFESPDPEFVVIPRPQIYETPTPLPQRVETLPLPQPVEIPAPVGVPVPVIPKPQVLPPVVPRTAPAPAPTTSPRPATAPRTPTRPAPAPSRLPMPFPSRLPFATPRLFPFLQPTPRVAPATQRLTRIETAVPRLQPATPLAQALPLSSPSVNQPTQTEKCQEVKRRRRRKGKCREGFFREFPGKTRYTEWRTVDCVTRKTRLR